MFAVIRPFLLVLIWLTAFAELILTAIRIHHTEHVSGFFERIIAALLATSLVTMLWVPYAFVTHLGRNRAANRSVGSGLLHEGSGIIPWLMWLVCTAIYTNDLPARRFCAFTVECNLRIAIQALGWIAFGLLTIYKVMLLMHASHHGLIGPGRASRGGAYNDKPVGPGPAVAGRV